MPIEMEWLIPDQVMGLRWWGEPTEEQLGVRDAEIVQILDATPTPQIHFISHELDLLTELPLKLYIQTKSPRHARFGWYIVIQPRHNAFARMVTQMACTVLGLQFRIVESEDAAWKHLQRVNPQFTQPVPFSSKIAS
jgi:hypothetical protein